MTSTIPVTSTGYTNPARYDDGVVRADPDPFVLRHRGRYYCYSTGDDGVNVATSTDLVEWTALGHALRRTDRSQYWAPCVIHADGTFWMYFSDRPAGCADPHEERLQLATSERPEGPFAVRAVLADQFAIDPHVVRDPATGEFHMFYACNGPTGLEVENPGTSIVVDRLVAMDRLAGRPRSIVPPTLDEEIFARDRFGDGRDWYTVEGPTYLHHHDTAYLMYSGNAYTGTDYFIGYASADADRLLGDLGWAKWPDPHTYAPLVRRSADVAGTGHNSVVTAPNLVDTFLVYHGRDATVPLDPDVEQRVMHIDRLFVGGAALHTDAPTSTPQERPARATVHDRFTGPHLRAGWQVLQGTATLDDEALRLGADGPALVVHERAVENAVLEVDVRARASDAGARFGVVVALHDVDHHVAVLLDAHTGTITARQVRRGVAEVLATASGPSDPDVWRLLRIERTFDDVEVWLDGRHVLAFRADLDGPARVGFTALRTAASFSGFAVTEHLDLHGPRLRHLPRIASSSATVVPGADGVGAATRRPVRLELDPLPTGVDLAVEVELPGPAAAAEIDLGAETLLRVDQDRVVLRHGGDVTEFPTPMPRHRVVVRTRATASGMRVRVGSRVHPIDCDIPAALRPAVTLTGARLRSIQITPVVGCPPDGDPPDDHPEQGRA